MTDRPVLFSAPMVQALLAGRKSQTRRLLRDAPEGPGWYCDPAKGGGYRWVAEGGAPSMPARLPFAAGDRLWVREACVNETSGQTWKRRWLREADRSECGTFSTREKPGRRAGMHMPRTDSRLTLIVTEVRVQRLQNISNEDALCEGVSPDATYPVLSFVLLWDSIHGQASWNRNPWVAAISFKTIIANIDASEAQIERKSA